MKKLLTFLSVAVLFAACNSDEDKGRFAIDLQPVEFVAYGESRSFDAYFFKIDSVAIKEKPEGWKIEVTNRSIDITAPRKSVASGEDGGDVTLDVYSGRSLLGVVEFEVNVCAEVNFEDPQAQNSLAGPTPYGDNLYEKFTVPSEGYKRYVSYTNPATGLKMGINESSGTYDFWSGGVAVSQWNNMSDNSYHNQCSVYYSDANGRGGHDGSATFAVATGYTSEYGVPSHIAFTDSREEVFDHFWVANTTQAYLVMENGNGYSSPFSYTRKDWFKLLIKGYGKNGELKSQKDFYLADFRTADAPGILHGWHRVDLSELGPVNKLVFDMESSDTGEFGMNNPAYFCFDDVAVRMLSRSM